MWRAGDLLSVESSVFLWRVEMAHDIDNYKEVGKSLERARRSLLPPADMERLVRSATRFHDVISQNQRSLAAIASQIESSSAVLRLGTRYADLAKAFESQLTLPKLAAITPNFLGAFQANAAGCSNRRGSSRSSRKRLSCELRGCLSRECFGR